MAFDPVSLLSNPAEMRKSYLQALGPIPDASAPVRVVQRIVDFKEVFDIWDMRPAFQGKQPVLVKADIPSFEVALEVGNDYLDGRVKIAASPKVLLEGK